MGWTFGVKQIQNRGIINGFFSSVLKCILCNKMFTQMNIYLYNRDENKVLLPTLTLKILLRRFNIYGGKF